MRKAAVIVGVICLLAGAVQADIGVRGRSDGGVYLAGGTWAGGGWPTSGSLYQLIWSPVAPVIEDITLAQATGGKTGELILTSGATSSYGYATPSALVEVFDAAANDGWIIMRIYQDDTPDIGDLFYQSITPTAPTLPAYDPLVPTSVFDHSATTAGSPQATNGTVIPEPATLGLWGLGLLTILVRRRIR
jgi:hypothetical protein